jgi:hypothetical protein
MQQEQQPEAQQAQAQPQQEQEQQQPEPQQEQQQHNDPLDHFDTIESFDDLLSLGSSSAQHLSPSRTASGDAEDHHTESGEISPCSWWKKNHSMHIPGSHSMMSNAVHMEIQENAKLPTFHWAVDRSGSTDPAGNNSLISGPFHPSASVGTSAGTNSTAAQQLLPYYNKTGDAAFDDLLAQMGASTADGTGTTGNLQPSSATTATATSGDDASGLITSTLNMTELFLQNQNRASLRANYAAAGKLSEEKPGKVQPLQPDSGVGSHNHNYGSKKSAAPSQQSMLSMGLYSMMEDYHNQEEEKKEPSAMERDPLESWTAEVDPTPLSEIKKRHEMHRASHDPQQSQPQSHFDYKDYHHYGRRYQLPIPTTNVSPPQSASNNIDSNNSASQAASSITIDAAATAAALANAADIVKDPAFVDYLATAAAIVSQTDTGGSTSASANSSLGPVAAGSASHPGMPIPTTTAGPYTTAQQTQSKLQLPQSLALPTQVGSKLKSSLSTAALFKGTTKLSAHTNVPSIQQAAQKKSQYGFGGNHVVPSVPQPPPPSQSKKNAKAKRPSKTTPKPNPSPAPSLSAQAANATSISLTYIQNNSSSSRGPPSPTPSATGSNASLAGAFAYERKKQRAKDARIKLNDSIERLGIAINMAGTQSKQRAAQWHASSSNNNVSIGSRHQKAGMQIMQDCSLTAESAKKWDRPSFVGSAAQLVQGLNAQCEALMREVLHLQEQQKKSGSSGSSITAGSSTTGSATAGTTTTTAGTTTTIAGTTTTATADNNAAVSAALEVKAPAATAGPTTSGTDAVTEVLPCHEKRPAMPQSVVTAEDESVATKRRRVEEVPTQEKAASSHQDPAPGEATHQPTMGESTNGGSVLTDAGIFSNKQVLNRIASFLDPVSVIRCLRVSKSWKDSGTFSDEEVWQDLSVSRFGFFNLRQWRGKLDDEEEVGSTPCLTLYKSMDAANVMPHFPHEGMFLLGEARLPGKVSAWTYLVERSNGETLRSVLREPSMAGNGVYASLPVVELRTVIQNTGVYSEPIVIREQIQTVDASTRRRGEEMREIEWDDRFNKRVQRVDGTLIAPESNLDGKVLCRLKLFEVAVVETYIYARGCTTTSKFVQRSNFTKVLVCLKGTTVPLVVPFPRDASILQL